MSEQRRRNNYRRPRSQRARGNTIRAMCPVENITDGTVVYQEISIFDTRRVEFSANNDSGLSDVEVSDLMAIRHQMFQSRRTRIEIKQLDSYVFENENHHKHHTCVICMDNFLLGETLKNLPCHHGFHARCIDVWLRENQTCPVCRQKAIG